jgi:UDP-N-acetylmuramyl pentapeptide phosphotransferase/UDP-N-acetylglucosamine-1-phosphate transferase
MVAALVSGLLTLILLLSKAGKEIQDIPNERSLHETPVPRIGGVGLMAGILSGWALMPSLLAWWFVLPALLLFGVSLVDDMKGLPVRTRLAAHLMAAFILVFGSGILEQDPLLAIALLLAVVWMTNLYNFMDGSDGLAGGMAFFGFTMYAVASLLHEEENQAMINFAVSSAALGFLFHNFYPARVFMGDAGSIPLGFLAAALGLWGWQHETWPGWFPFMVFSPFIVDATVTLIKRSVRRARVTEAHREHYYQRMVQMGWGHRNVALAEYALMLASGATAIWAEKQTGNAPWIMLVAWAGIYSILMLVVDSRWRAFQRSSQ